MQNKGCSVSKLLFCFNSFFSIIFLVSIAYKIVETMKRVIKLTTLTTIIVLSISVNLWAWSEHPLLAHQVLKGIPELGNAQNIEVRELKTFLIRNEKAIEQSLAELEAWARANLPNYDPLPEILTFKATGNRDDIVIRFYSAIRINPNVKMRLYLHLIPGENAGNRITLNPSDLTTLSDVSEMKRATYVAINEGDMVSPLSVLVSANDEPDYGFDLGLYEDNNTDYGKIYGFGKQPFGNPNLEYGSQAPFHMGFYHEAKIIFKFGAFLKKTYPEFRIQQYKLLSQLAFELGEEYWGYRFMGWGMHYLGDMSMPYHTAPLPGASTLKMLWINVKAMMGFPKSKDNAVQMVSNKHSVFERFQWLELRRAYETYDTLHPLMVALRTPIELVPYGEKFTVQVAAKSSVLVAKKVDKTLNKWVPKRLVRDPKFEASGSAELVDLVKTIDEYKGAEGVSEINKAIAQRFSCYSMHLTSYFGAINRD